MTELVSIAGENAGNGYVKGVTTRFVQNRTLSWTGAMLGNDP